MAGSEQLIRSPIPEITRWLASTTAGLKKGKDLKQTDGRAGVSYYIFGDDSSDTPVAVFKPLKGERAVIKPSEGSFVEGAPEGLKKGTKAGKGGYREAAAYILDHPKSGRRSVSREAKGFAGVPPTTFGSCYYRKGGDAGKGPITESVGSLQMYMENEGNCKDNIDADVCNKFPDDMVDEVHKIAVLDIRLANADRHGGNILRSKSNSVLIPIDHGYCFPGRFGGDKFVWLNWSQAQEPFSPETIKYIKTLDAQEDIDLLKSYGWVMPLPVARVFRVSTMLLKKGADKGLTPHAIGRFMYSLRNKELPKIEKIFDKASKNFPLKEDDDKFINAVSQEIDSHLDEIAKRLRSAKKIAK